MSVLLSACSLTPTKNITNFNLKESLDKICLSQEGKGRFKEKSTKIFFTYETLNSPKKNMFQLVMDIPLYGSESVTVDYKDMENPVVTFEGEENKGKKAKQLVTFKRFILTFTNFVVLKEAISHKGQDEYCEDDGSFVRCALSPGAQVFRIKKLQQMLKVKAILSSSRNLSFEFFDLKEQFFTRIKTEYTNEVHDRAYFSGDLFVNGCFDKVSVH